MNFTKIQSIAVTGGAGLIGSSVVDLLVDQGNHVIVIDDFSKGLKENLSQSRDKIEVREGNLEDRKFAIDALSDCSIVYHFASRAYGVGYGEGRHLEILNHNERITTNLVEAFQKHRPEKALITSSSCVYDDNGPDIISELPVFDNKPEHANRGYGWAKRFLEQKMRLLMEETGIQVTTVRPFNIYGERYKWVGEFSQAIPMLVKRVLDGVDPVVVWGSGNQKRSYIHAHDCARMMILFLQSGYVGGPVNLGTTDTVSMRELVQLICKTAGLNPEINFDRSKPEGRIIKSSDTNLMDKILVNPSFKISLEEGIQRMIWWYNTNFSDDKLENE